MKERMWYRLQCKTTKASSEKIPFDLIYILPVEELDTFKKVYDIFLLIKPDKKLIGDILNCPLDELVKEGIGRKDSSKIAIVKDNNAKLNLKDYLSLNSNTVFCVPVLARKTGKKSTPMYIVTKPVLREITLKENNYSKYNILPRPGNPEKILSEMTILVNGEEQIPCGICANGIQKSLDNTVCLLGSESCLNKINLKGVNCFTDETENCDNTQEA